MQDGNLTPGITRREGLREASGLAHDIHALSGRMHAVVRVRSRPPLALRATIQPFISRPSNAPPDGEYHAGLHEADAPAPTSGAPKEISRNATFTQPFCQQRVQLKV